LLSVLTKDCVENLTDTCHRGARYDLWHILCEAVSNAADAAAAIQKFVFEEKVVTLPDLVVNIGKRIGASADGRKSHEPIAANMSPVPSRDISGPTAAINSYLKLNTSSMAAGAPIDLRVSINGLEGEEGTRRIAALVETFIEMGGNMMTLTITSVEELRRAMENPEKYRGLRVRMGGWSAYYTLLSKESQKIHLKRVEHGLV
jgi:pyruvate-formate lyase